MRLNSCDPSNTCEANPHLRQLSEEVRLILHGIRCQGQPGGAVAIVR